MAELSNARHEQFCQQFLLDLNATAAYRRAYPDCTQKAAETAGPRLLGNVGVQKRIAELKAERAERVQIEQDDVLRELYRLGFSNMRDFVVWGPSGVTLVDCDDLDENATRCVAEVSQTVTKEGGSIKFKLHDKVGALTKLGQHVGLFEEKLSVTGRVLLVESLDQIKPTNRIGSGNGTKEKARSNGH